jgi:hypothetical protein
MVSGAGRRLTCLPASAWAARWVTERVAAVGSGTGGGHQGPVADAGKGSFVGREFLIDCAPVGRGQARRFAHQQRGPPLIQLSRLQGSERVRHLSHQSLCQAQQPASLGRGFATGEGNLCSNACPKLVCGDAGIGLLPTLQLVKGDGQPGLTGSQGRLPVFQCPDLINQPAAVLRRGTARRNTAAAQGSTAQRQGCIVRCRLLSACATAPQGCWHRFGPRITVHGSSVPLGYDIHS